MLVYRITLNRYAQKPEASVRAARWNPNKTEMIYTSANRSLSCLENIVHRGKTGLMQLFSVMTIEIPDEISTIEINLKQLPENWKDYDQLPFTQNLGEKWIDAGQAAVLQVPSSVIEDEVNYLINPKHPDFKRIKLIKTQPFVFDKRVKL